MANLSELDRLLSFMEDHIDLIHISEIEQLQYNAVSFQDVDRLPLTIRTLYDEYKLMSSDAAYSDPEKMLYNEILWSGSNSPYNSVRIKDDAPLTIRSNYGAGIIASLFGCKPILYDNQMIKIEKINLDYAKKVFSKGIPALNQALGKMVIETCQHYRERLAPYPKCRQAIRITQPDLRGPYDIFHLILGDEAFILPYDDPVLTKYIMNVIAETYISYINFIDPYLNNSINNDAIFIDGICSGGKALIKADIATANLSPDVYRLCEGDPDAYIMRSLGGGSLSFCGGFKGWHAFEIINEYLRCINFRNSELYHLSSEYQFLKNKGVAIAGWGCGQGYNAILGEFDKGDQGAPIITGLTLMTESGDVNQGIEILKRHKEICHKQRVAYS